jgi:xylose dehydrogenase (NAD/NADP)
LDQRLSWGVLGTANIARSQVVPAIRSSTNGCVAAVAGRDVSRTRDFAKLLGIDTAFESYAALIASPEIDAVYIPLPNSLHADWAIKAANAGKAVLCEKPLALNGDEAQGVVDAFSSRGVPLMEGFMYRFHPQNLHVLKLVADGVIGEVREVRSHLSVQIMDPPDTGNVRFNAVLGGGSLLDMGCYAINVARHVMGDEPGSVMGILYTDPQFGVDLSAAAILEFGGGRTAAISSSFCAGGQGVYQVIGTKGVIEVPRAIILGMGSRLGEGLVVVVDEDGRRTETRFEAVDQYRLMVEAFAAAVLLGAPVPYDPRDSIRNLRVCDAIVASHRSGSRAEVRS